VSAPTGARALLTGPLSPAPHPLTRAHITTHTAANRCPSPPLLPLPLPAPHAHRSLSQRHRTSSHAAATKSVTSANAPEKTRALTGDTAAQFQRFWESHSAEPLKGRDVIVRSVCPQVARCVAVSTLCMPRDALTFFFAPVCFPFCTASSAVRAIPRETLHAADADRGQRDAVGPRRAATQPEPLAHLRRPRLRQGMFVQRAIPI